MKNTFRNEQMELLLNFDLPEGIALNDSLLENTYVSLICILNNIPLIICGKPGSSKTLSI